MLCKYPIISVNMWLLLSFKEDCSLYDIYLRTIKCNYRVHYRRMKTSKILFCIFTYFRSYFLKIILFGHECIACPFPYPTDKSWTVATEFFDITCLICCISYFESISILQLRKEVINLVLKKLVNDNDVIQQPFLS